MNGTGRKNASTGATASVSIRRGSHETTPRWEHLSQLAYGGDFLSVIARLLARPTFRVAQFRNGTPSGQRRSASQASAATSSGANSSRNWVSVMPSRGRRAPANRTMMGFQLSSRREQNSPNLRDKLCRGWKLKQIIHELRFCSYSHCYTHCLR